jgi:hypothetical protein
MEPQQPYGSFPAPPTGNPYEFITNPQKPGKPPRPGLPSVSGGSFVGKLVLIIGGGVGIIVVLFVVINLVFSGSTNLTTLIQVAETQQEIIRVANLAQNNGVTDETVAGGAMNTLLTVTTQQQNTIDYLALHRQKVPAKTLALKRDAATDQRISQAKATSTLDIVFPQIMRQELTDYSTQLKTNYDGATSKSLKAMLATQYNQTQLLIKQWPAD